MLRKSQKHPERIPKGPKKVLIDFYGNLQGIAREPSGDPTGTAREARKHPEVILRDPKRILRDPKRILRESKGNREAILRDPKGIRRES